MIQPHQVKDRRLQIADVLRALDRPVADLVGAAVDGAAFDAGPSQPGSEAFGIVVATGEIGRASCRERV